MKTVPKPSNTLVKNRLSSLTKLPYPDNLPKVLESLNTLAHPVWLDSGYQNSRGNSIRGRYDILSADPLNIFSDPSYIDINKAIDELNNACDTQAEKNFKNTRTIKNDITEYEPELEHIPFIGGAIGYFNYEHNSDSFSLNTPPSLLRQSHNLRKSYVGIFDWCFVVDHKEKKSFLIFLNVCPKQKEKHITEIIERNFQSKNLENPLKNSNQYKTKNLSPNTTKQEYINSLKIIKKYIVEGDTYQINYSQRFSADFTGSSMACYSALREKLPSPYSAYIDLSDDKILCFSPERFIDIKNRVASTKPIKGTAPRGKTLEEDKRLSNQLMASQKNRAENLMIVDLLRNDFSQLCEAHSVLTPKLFALESFANVHHLVSTVTGKLKQNATPLELFEACFPGGSITGAPKKRAMEIILELEKYPRNIYCGSVFYFDIRGKLDSNIAIRTLLISEKKLYCWGGGGIVHDSNIEEEYQETFHKVDILLNALNT